MLTQSCSQPPLLVAHSSTSVGLVCVRVYVRVCVCVRESVVMHLATLPHYC